MAEMSPVRVALEETRIVDTHEHIRPLAEVREGPWDLRGCLGACEVFH